MSNIVDLMKQVARRIKESPREQPSTLTIAADHTDRAAALADPFRRDEDYFEVEVSELYLAAGSKWLVAIDPLVFIASEFTYDTGPLTVPFVVGPGLLKDQELQASLGIVLRDTLAAGPHPWRGGRLALTVVLCQTVVEDYARQLLGVLGSMAGSLDFSPTVAAYTKVAGIVLDGVESMLGMAQTTPLASFRTELKDGFTPGYFALINAPDIDETSLWIRKGQLCEGTSLASAKAFRRADYALYSVLRPADGRRSDISKLPFYPLWERVIEEASGPSPQHYESAVDNMHSLNQTLMLSPDLTEPHAASLSDEYVAKMEKFHERAERIAKPKVGRLPLGGGTGPGVSKDVALTDLDRARARSFARLKR